MSTQETTQGTTPASKFIPPLPRAVAASVQQAEQIIQQMAAQQEATSQAVTQEGNAQQEAPPQPVTQEGNAQQEAPRAEAQPQQEAPKAESKAAPQPTQTKDGELTIDQLMRRYDAARGRAQHLERINQELGRENDQLRAELAALQNARPTADDGGPRYVTDEEVRDYGPDLLNVVEKKAREVAERLVQPLVSDVTNVKQRVQMNATQEMYAYLDREEPKWRDTNVSDEFKDWLNQYDIMSGHTRFDMLKKAHAANDGPRVAAFFKAYAQESAALAPPAPANPAPSQPRVSLEKLAAPGRPMSAAPERPSDVPEVFTRAQISKFYADRAAGKYRGREADADAIERRIFQATSEGRIAN